MIVTETTKEIIQTYVDKFVPEGISSAFHVDCRKHMFAIVEVLIEKDIIQPDILLIKDYCVNWEELMVKKFSLLN